MNRRAFLALIVGLGIFAQAQAPAPKVTSYFTPNRQREDFVAASDNQPFQCTGAGVGSYVEVFRNGLLQRLGPAGQGDYTSVSVGGAQKVTFNPGVNGAPVPVAGEWVTLIYYR